MTSPTHSNLSLMHGGMCRSCGYSLNQLPVERTACPECGSGLAVEKVELTSWGVNEITSQGSFWWPAIRVIVPLLIALAVLALFLMPGITE